MSAQTSIKSVTAKFKVNSINEYEGGKMITLSAVVGYDGVGNRIDENESWSKYTPSGNIEINITNPEAYNQFTVGKSYYINFTEAV